jgi:RsiW-degrading membrane proteinase PrsW (M82 family)
VSATLERRPRLPAWLSLPVAIAGVPVLAGLVLLAIASTAATLLGFVPLLIVGPTMLWLDRVEPEPRSSLVHAFLWGATVAVLVSGFVNTGVILLTSEEVAAVVSAPLVEEAMKGLGVAWAVRRAQVDGPMDGIVYAGWVGLGFAVVENALYFVNAEEGGVLAATFVVRALLGPFAHPLFTAWIGLALGRAVARGGRFGPSIGAGYALAVGAHALWNGSLTASAAWGDSGLLIAAVAMLAFVSLFTALAAVLARQRRRDERRFLQLVPWLAAHYGLTHDEVVPFARVGSTLRARRALPRAERRRFDRLHGALARLAALQDRPGGVDPVMEARLVENLRRARERAG